MATFRLSGVRLPWENLTPLSDKFQHILSLFPQDLSFAFAYGSGAFQQHGHKPTEYPLIFEVTMVILFKANVVDVILVVENAEAFHEANLKHNWKHYSSIRYLGSKALTSFQENWGARVYFNTLVPYRYGLFKYGVISSSAMIADLLDWEWLYVSGRLHKPTLPLIVPESHQLRAALQHNLQSALHVALLLLPEVFQEEVFYQTIAGLSYTGDFRMTFGEDKNKVKNIVAPQLDKFRELYAPFYFSFSSWADLGGKSARWEQDTSPSARLFHLNLLPKKIQQTFVHEWNRDGRWQDVEDVFRAAAHDTECHELVNEAVQRTVRVSSWTQSLKNIPTAGIVKSLRYSLAKVLKMWKSLKK
nr:EOG090X06VP [Macrothrix elegans]